MKAATVTSRHARRHVEGHRSRDRQEQPAADQRERGPTPRATAWALCDRPASRGAPGPGRAGTARTRRSRPRQDDHDRQRRDRRRPGSPAARAPAPAPGPGEDERRTAADGVASRSERAPTTTGRKRASTSTAISARDGRGRAGGSAPRAPAGTCRPSSPPARSRTSARPGGRGLPEVRVAVRGEGSAPAQSSVEHLALRHRRAGRAGGPARRHSSTTLARRRTGAQGADPGTLAAWRPGPGPPGEAAVTAPGRRGRSVRRWPRHAP